MDNWMMHTGRLREQGHFRWYTMTATGNFSEPRKEGTWKEAAGRPHVDD